MRLSIFWRLAFSSLAIVALMAGVNLYALSQIRQLTALSSELVSFHYPAIDSAQGLLANLYSQLRSEKQYLAVRDPLFQKHFEDEGQQFRQALGKMTTAEQSPDARKLLADLRSMHDQYHQTFVRRARGSSDDVPGGRRDRLMADMNGLLQTYIDMHQVKIGTVLSDARARSERAELVTRELGLVTLVLAFTFAALASYTILRPLRRLQDQFREIGRGNFSAPVVIDAPRDLQALVDTANWMRHKLHELDEMKTDFLAHISHELRTPVASIREGTHLLLDEIPGTLTEDQRKILQIMNDSSQRLIRLISTLLDLSKMEAGMMEYRIVPTDLKRVAENSMNKVRLLAEGKHVKILAEYPRRDLVVPADAVRIEQVLDNLLSNALKFSPEGAVINVRIAEGDEPETVCVSVNDTGCGIDPADLPHVFDRFYQGRLRAKNKLAGSGLGLALAKKVVEAHGGAIHIESEQGKGTSVAFTLPLYRAGASS